jgi:hypothetical protein
MTTVTVDPASPSTRVPRRTWLGVLSLGLGAAIIVTTEFTPVGFLPDVAGDVHVSLGAAGLMILVPGLSAAVAAPVRDAGQRSHQHGEPARAAGQLLQGPQPPLATEPPEELAHEPVHGPTLGWKDRLPAREPGYRREPPWRCHG